MANRRMFSLKVVDTDTFLDMSSSAQNLYFHLGMRADDDGFVSSPKKIMVMVNASEDDMKVLIAKNFVIKMATNGVSVITHWHTNNLIRPDRYQETEYKEEKTRLNVVDGKYNQSFGIPNDNQMPTIGLPSIGKVRLGKVKKDNAETSSALPPNKKDTGNEVMTLEEFVKSCRSSPQRYIRLIGEYADEKKLDYSTKGQWRAFMKRNFRPAKNLEPYTDIQISRAMKSIDKEKATKDNPKGYITKWTLETISKFLEK